MMMAMLAALAAPGHANQPDAAAAWEQFTAHVDPETGAMRPHEHGPACLTGVMGELRDSLDALPPEQHASALRALEPWRVAWEARGLQQPPASCIGRYGEQYVEGEHFTVEWDDDVISESQAQAFLDSLEFSWGVEVDELGWIGPSGASSTPILVYVQSGNYAGAYTSVLECSEGNVNAMPYIVTYEGSFRAGSWYKTMAAHEFKHAIQFYYGYAHEFYYWEASATWMEEYVYPSLNDWADPIAYGYSQQPHIAMNASDQNDQDVFWHMYAMGIWNFYLDEHVGGHDLVQSVWEAASRERGTYSYWMPDAIADVGLDFAETYAGFMATVAVMDFSEPRYFLLPQLADSVSELPAEGAAGNNPPQSLGQNFIQIAAGAAEEGERIEVAFDGEDGVPWFAVLARGTDNNLDTYVSLELGEDGAGTGAIEAVDGQDVYLIVSPMDEDAVGGNYNWSRATGFDYTWSAEVVEEVAGGGKNNNGNKDEKAGLCATSASAAGAGWLLSLALVGWRRRR